MEGFYDDMVYWCLQPKPDIDPFRCGFFSEESDRANFPCDEIAPNYQLQPVFRPFKQCGGWTYSLLVYCGWHLSRF